MKRRRDFGQSVSGHYAVILGMIEILGAILPVLLAGLGWLGLRVIRPRSRAL